MSLKHLLRGILRFTFALAVTLGLPVSLGAAGGPEQLSLEHPKVKEVIAVQERFTRGLMAQPEILGTAVGQDADGDAVLIIYVNNETKNLDEVMRAMPAALGGKRVRAEVTEPFRAFRKPGGGNRSNNTRPGGGGVSHTAEQTPPIQLGTSGGWANDIANGYCCSGTLGCLVSRGGIQYILSNYHVLEGDGEPAGSPVIQPGLVDVNCTASAAQVVAHTSGIKSLPNSNVDAAIAQVVNGMVRTDGSILQIGTISRSTVAASIGQAVKKSGRTTGLSTSKVSGLNATVSVQYESSCAGSQAFTKTFTGQIVVANSRSKFLNSGDSGSLMVENVSTNPRAVGLLFAGSSTSAIANPIDEVLAFFGATMVGQ
jgi:hypothetical protein